VVKAAVLSEQHWEAAEQLLKVLRPIVKVLRLGDSNQPAMGKVSLSLGSYSTLARASQLPLV
jgi:hypothetical protein